DVGGIREALGDTGILVEPRNPSELATGLLKLLTNDALRYELGEEARIRALSYFTLDQVLDHHLKSYLKLSLKSSLFGNSKPLAEDFNRVTEKTTEALGALRDIQKTGAQQKLLAEKGYALMDLGFLEQANSQFRRAVAEDPHSPGVPVYLSEIAKIYNKLGNYEAAMNEMEKVNTFLEMQTIADASIIA
ncbi:MAG: hypothetical protein Q8898_14625, partial [Bacillota bacterium]|nr:hypothetical protein [Bacillota bacterium]